MTPFFVIAACPAKMSDVQRCAVTKEKRRPVFLFCSFLW
jgi:hypothetical protein